MTDLSLIYRRSALKSEPTILTKIKTFSTLALLVARVSANHANHAMAPHDFAFTANALDRSLYSHHFSPQSLLLDNSLEIRTASR